jgi:signal transduction histidine kinase
MVFNKLKELKKYSPYFTGESIIPLKIYFMALPGITFFTIVAQPDLMTADKINLWILAAICAIIVTGLFVMFCKYVVFAYAKHISIPISHVFLYALILGTVKGYSTFYFVTFFKLHDHGLIDIHLLYRLIPAIISTLFFVPIASWIHYSLEKYKKLRSELMTKAAKLQLENQSYKKLIEESKLTLKNKMEYIFKDIRKELIKIENNESFEQEWPKIAKLVRDAALQEIRPVSHNLWDNQTKNFREFNFKNFLVSAIKTNPFPWKIVIPIYFTTSYVAIFFDHPDAVNLLTIIGVFIVFILFNVGNYLHKHLKEYQVLNYSLIIAMTTVATYLNLKFVSNYFEITDINFLLFTSVVWLFLLTLVCSLVTTVSRTKDEILNEIEVSLNQQQIHKSTLASIEKRINSKLAKFLHGHVQARLMSNSLQLEIATKNNDSNLAVRELNRLTKDIVEEYGIMDQFQTDTTFSEEMEKIQASWAGICEIEVLGHRNLQIDQLIIKDFIEDAISEAIANSVRHGLADKVKIQFFKNDSDRFEIQISDNGVGPLNPGAGMGSEIFNLLSKDKWTLIPNITGKGSTLILPVVVLDDLQVSNKLETK